MLSNEEARTKAKAKYKFLANNLIYFLGDDLYDFLNSDWYLDRFY